MIEQLENRQFLSTSPLNLGISITSNPNLYNVTNKLLKDTGLKTVRLWYGTDYNFKYDDTLKMASKYHNAGYKVLMSVVPNNGRVGTPKQVSNLFNSLMNYKGVKNSVDLWEIGNEPDLKKFWRSSLKNYLNRFLKPAANVLHKFGEKVISAGVSWNPNDIKSMVQLGMLKFVDYVGYHPYRKTVADLKAQVSLVKSYAGNKPLVATEWNVIGYSGSKLANMIKSFWPVINSNFYASYYFNAIQDRYSIGHSGAIFSNGKHNEPFYSIVKSFHNNKIKEVVKVVKNTVIKPVILGYQIINSLTGKAIPGYFFTESQTIHIKSMPTRDIDIVAVTSSNTQSVETVFNGKFAIQNVLPYSFINRKLGLFKGLKMTIIGKAFTKDNAKGFEGLEKSITLYFR